MKRKGCDRIPYSFKQDEVQKIIEHFGNPFYERLLKNLDRYAAKWELDILHFIDYYSVNCIFVCQSKRFGEAILKIGNPSNGVSTEVNALKEYNGFRFCRVFDADVENGIILEEYIKPGSRLREVQSLEDRLCIFSELYNGLHIPPQQPEIYPRYFEWVSGITEYMRQREDYKELYRYMKKAKDICSELCAMYPPKMLLHGDLHHDNILLGKEGRYRLIDPKGVIGDPIFDIPRFILNEFDDDDNNISYDDYSKRVEKIAAYLGDSLAVSPKTIKKCLFVETAMANCWCVESGEAPDMNPVVYTEHVMHHS